MAQLEKLIPHIFKWEVGIDPKQLNLTNEQAFEKAKLKGVITVQGDTGGATFVGVTFATFCQYCTRKRIAYPTVQKLGQISYATWLDILHSMFWQRWKADEIKSQSVAEALVDWAWTSGNHGIRIPQQLLGVAADGVVGPKTLAAVNAENPEQFFVALRLEREKFFRSIAQRTPSKGKFLPGWLNRLNDLKFKS